MQAKKRNVAHMLVGEVVSEEDTLQACIVFFSKILTYTRKYCFGKSKE